MNESLNHPPVLGRTLAEGLAGRYMRVLDMHSDRLLGRAWSVPWHDRPARYLRAAERALRSYRAPWTLDVGASGKKHSRRVLCPTWYLDGEYLAPRMIVVYSSGVARYHPPVRVTQHALGRLLQTYRPEAWADLVWELDQVAMTVLEALMRETHARTYRAYTPSADNPEEGEVYLFAGYEPQDAHPYGYCLRTVVGGIREGQGHHGYAFQRMRNNGSSWEVQLGDQWVSQQEQAVAA